MAKFFKKVRGARAWKNGYWSYPCSMNFKAEFEFGGARFAIPSKCASVAWQGPAPFLAWLTRSRVRADLNLGLTELGVRCRLFATPQE